MRSFKEAEQYGKLAIDSLTVAQAQFKMGKMLLDTGMKQEALAMLQTAHSNFGNRFVDKALTQNILSVCYLLQGDFDNAETYLHQSLLDMEISQSEVNKLNRKIWNNYAVLYRIQGKHDQAIDCLYRMMEDSGLDENEIFMSSLNLGNVFFDIKEMDSAAKYYQHIEDIMPTVNLKKETIASAYSALSRFAEKQNDAVLALQYREKHEKILYDLMLQQQEQTIYRILLLITTILILLLQYRHKQLLKSEEEMKQQLDDLKQDLLQTVKISVLDHEISSRLRLILKVHDKTLQGNDPKKEWQSLVWQIMNGKEDPFEAARSVLETAYPKLYSTIKESYPNLTETETKICLLSCSDLSNAEIAELLGLSTNTINQNRSNLRKKLNLKPDKMKEQLRQALSN